MCHGDSVVLVQNHTCSCDCDVAIDPRQKFPLWDFKHAILYSKEMHVQIFAPKLYMNGVNNNKLPSQNILMQ